MWTPSPRGCVYVWILCEALSHGSSLGQSTLTDVYSCATPCMGQQLRPPFRWPQLQCACVCFQKLCILTGKGIPCFGRIRFADLTLKPRLAEHTHKPSVFFFLHVAIRNSLRSNNPVHVRAAGFTDAVVPCTLMLSTRTGTLAFNAIFSFRATRCDTAYGTSFSSSPRAAGGGRTGCLP